MSDADTIRAILARFTDEPESNTTFALPVPRVNLRGLLAENERLREALRISYPMTPVDALISDLTSLAELSEDEAMWEDFVRRTRDWQAEKDALAAVPEERE